MLTKNIEEMKAAKRIISHPSEGAGLIRDFLGAIFVFGILVECLYLGYGMGF